MAATINILEKNVSYEHVDDRDVLLLINAIKRGIAFALFHRKFFSESPFSIHEWSNFLHISERTMQRYKKEKRTFDAMQSERILEIALLYRLGAEVFGSNEKFNSWLETENLALGKIKPKALLDNSFGINLLKDEITRIEHGVLA